MARPSRGMSLARRDFTGFNGRGTRYTVLSLECFFLAILPLMLYLAGPLVVLAGTRVDEPTTKTRDAMAHSRKSSPTSAAQARGPGDPLSASPFLLVIGLANPSDECLQARKGPVHDLHVLAKRLFPLSIPLVDGGADRVHESVTFPPRAFHGLHEIGDAGGIHAADRTPNHESKDLSASFGSWPEFRSC